jgi:hypothetical protein
MVLRNVFAEHGVSVGGAEDVSKLRYITPARVTDGTFKNPDPSVDTTFIDPQYIGAELISLFKRRDYKIYSNLVTAQMAQKPKRILLIIGAAHVGSLKNIFRDDPDTRPPPSPAP